MRLKLQKSLIILFLLGLFAYGCIEEPFIEPVKRPFSVIRVANFTSNLNPLTVEVDGKTVGTLAVGELTNYFDVNSGGRTFTIKDNAGNTVFSKSIQIISYEEETVVLAGYYSSVDTLNTFALTTYTDGLTYIYELPKADTSVVHVINCLTDTPTEAGQKVNLSYVSGTDTTSAFTAAAFADKNTFSLGQGDYTFIVSDDSTSISKNVTIGNQKRYTVFIHGTAMSIEATVDEQTSLPARSK